MINLLKTLAFTQILTGIFLVILGITVFILQRRIRKLEELKYDSNIQRAIRKYELEWGE